MARVAEIRVVGEEALAREALGVRVAEGQVEWVEARAVREVHLAEADRKGQTSATASHSAQTPATSLMM